VAKPRRVEVHESLLFHIGFYYFYAMAIKFKHSNVFSTYFITFTFADWLPLFEITYSYDLVYNWFAVLKQTYNADVVAYVIMPNHLHVILHFQNEYFNLNNVISNGKRFIAYEIVNRLEKAQNYSLLEKLNGMLTERERKKGQQHKVFKDSFDAKEIITQKFLLQKINYIHNNPVSGKWMLAKDFVAYEHSSASFYEIQQVKHWKPMHYLDL
jgi:REP element-mobilizing transposase RayT